MANGWHRASLTSRILIFGSFPSYGDSGRYSRVLLGLYNQVLDQLEVELDAAKECLEASVSLERRWVKTILSMANKRAKLETENGQRFSDLRAERDEARQDLTVLRESQC